MKTIKAKPITVEAFAPYGEYCEMTNPSGYALCGEIHKFYPDRITSYTGNNISFSPLVVKKPERMIISAVEYHTTTCELILPVNDDMILHVAPASAGAVIPENTEAFIVKKGTLVKIKEAIWHLAPLPLRENELYAMIVLPACTYASDCTVVDIEEDKQFEIVI